MPREAPQGRALIAGLLLAAGRSARFGRQKLLEPWRGAPLVRYAAMALVGGGLAPVLAVVPDQESLAPALDGLPIELVVNPDSDWGISHSIRLGVDAMPPDVAAVAIALGDQPLLTPEAVTRLRMAFRPGAIVAPRYGRWLGTPRIYDRRFFGELRALTGDTGAQALAARHPEAIVEVDLPAEVGADVDTVGDWEEVLGGRP